MTTYNITQGDAGHWEKQIPGEIDVIKLVPGDHIGKYVEVDIHYGPWAGTLAGMD